MDEIVLTEENEGSAKLYLGTVTSWFYQDKLAKIRLDGQDTEMTKRFKSACGELRSGSRVVVAKISGTYVVLGVIDSDAYVTNNISSVATPGTNVTLANDGSFARWGKVAMLRLRFTPTATWASGPKVVATLKSGYRPVIVANAQYWSGIGAYINTSGQVTVNGGASSTSAVYTVYSTFILA